MGMDTLIGAIFLGAFGWLYLMFLVVAGTVGIAAAALWIWMLVEVLSRETDENNNRLIWALVIIFTHSVGALIYIFARRGERIRRLGK